MTDQESLVNQLPYQHLTTLSVRYYSPNGKFEWVCQAGNWTGVLSDVRVYSKVLGPDETADWMSRKPEAGSCQGHKRYCQVQAKALLEVLAA